MCFCRLVLWLPPPLWREEFTWRRRTCSSHLSHQQRRASAGCRAWWPGYGRPLVISWCRSSSEFLLSSASHQLVAVVIRISVDLYDLWWTAVVFSRYLLHVRCKTGGSWPQSVSYAVIRSCSRDPTESILTRVKTLGQTFKDHYTNDSEDTPGSHIGTAESHEFINEYYAFPCLSWAQLITLPVVVHSLLRFVSDFAENRLKLAEILYYKVLENVMVQETKRLHGKDMSVSSTHHFL